MENIDITHLENGIYTAKISVSDDIELYSHEFDFAVAENVTKGNTDSIFATCLHISGIKKDTEQMDSMMYMLKNSGVDYIRDEYYWDHVELEKGEYTFYADDYINACVENGIKP